MAKQTCHGCEGKGWVMIIRSERVTPFLSKVDNRPTSYGVMTREYDPAVCIICRGDGVVKNGATPDLVIEHVGGH